MSKYQCGCPLQFFHANYPTPGKVRYATCPTHRVGPTPTFDRPESRDAYQMHGARFTQEQMEVAAKLAGRLSFA